MNRIQQILVWISRIHRCRGFGIQSPSDYRFVRYVIDERWPYYAYERLGSGDGWLAKKIGCLCFRLTNWRQPKNVIDLIGVADYVKAACKDVQIVTVAEHVELALVPVTVNYQSLLDHCDDHSVVLFNGIYRHTPLWRCIESDPRVTISFDLYYCGIVMFDAKREKQRYVINF
jgi:hypothetical protein